MNVGLCRSGRESGLIHVSLLSGTIRDVRMGEGDLGRICRALSDRFGYETVFETNRIHDSRQDDTYWPPFNGPFGIPRPVKPTARRYPRRLLQLNKSSRDKLAWAFFHRGGEMPYSEGLPTKKSVSIFCRNASDGCVPCTFHCPGCDAGGVRIAASGLSPYGIDSEVLGEAAADCLGSALSGDVEVDYEKKGLMWNGYVPAAVRHFSGTWLNMAMLDYLHRFSGVMSDFNYPNEFREKENTIEDGGRIHRLRWIPSWIARGPRG